MSEYVIEPNIWNSNNFFFGLSQIHRRAVIGSCGIKGLKSYAYSGRGCNAEYFFQCDGNSFSVISELILLVVIGVSSSVLPKKCGFACCDLLVHHCSVDRIYIAGRKAVRQGKLPSH